MEQQLFAHKFLGNLAGSHLTGRPWNPAGLSVVALSDLVVLCICVYLRRWARNISIPCSESSYSTTTSQNGSFSLSVDSNAGTGIIKSENGFDPNTNWQFEEGILKECIIVFMLTVMLKVGQAND